jgi:hypothetical protein
MILDLSLYDCYAIVPPMTPDLLQLNPLIYELAITIMYMMTQVSIAYNNPLPSVQNV